LPDVRSDEDCRRLIAALKKPLYRACFALIYAYGLRITEAVSLPISAVDSKQMVLRVIGKGNKERALPLTEHILQMLREVENPPQRAVALSQPALGDPSVPFHRTRSLREGTR
jgi:site-specific recombinase XerD